MIGVLIADAGRSTNALVGEVLDALDVAVYFVTTDGENVLEQARRYRPDLIILDMMLPRINGIEACTILKTDPALMGIPVLLVVPCDDPAYRYLARQARADGFVCWPFDPQTLLKKVAQMMPSPV